MEAVERLAIDFRGILLIDEAYADFVDPASSYDTTQLVRRYPNVLLMRTLSKGYSLAGLRLAYCIGQAELIRPMLEKTKDSYNVDAVSQLLGVAALEDPSYASRSWEHVRRERERLSTELQDLGFPVLPSQTNFLLVSIPENSGWSGAQLLQRQLQRHGVYVRWFDEDRLRKRLRISIGTTDENNALLRALRALQGPALGSQVDVEDNQNT
jgi:histidinol-phosphate aminotransferase